MKSIRESLKLGRLVIECNLDLNEVFFYVEDFNGHYASIIVEHSKLKMEAQKCFIDKTKNRIEIYEKPTS